MKSSSYSGFYKLSTEQRLNEVAEFAELNETEVKTLTDPDVLDMEKADHMVENVIGRFTLPIGVGLNFVINGEERLIPMVTEEPSVVAACSNGARMIKAGGGFTTSYDGSNMIGQIQLLDIPNPEFAQNVIYQNKEKIMQICNDDDPVLVKMGGGVKDVQVRILDSEVGKMVVVHLIIDCKDAMGANTANGMAEVISTYLEEITGGRAQLRILSNLADQRLARARAIVKKETVGGEEVVDKIVEACAFAAADPYRAATHNKGIMNGIIPVVLGTGNDTRAMESAVHSYAARSGQYSPLSTWEKTKDGDLAGSIVIPVPIGTVGGSTTILPTAQTILKIMGIKDAADLAQVIACVGLANNIAALKALSTEGIQRGHMSLHARNLATVAGAKGEVLEKIIKKMVEDNKVRLEYAVELLAQYEK